jgi:hypothetical protein
VLRLSELEARLQLSVPLLGLGREEAAFLKEVCFQV